MSRLAFALFVSLLGACAPGGSGSDAGGLPMIEVRGRVVDFESCSTLCRGVEGVVVAWGGAPDMIQSQPTTSEGSFILAGVPSGFRSDLHALPTDRGTGSLYAATINPMLISADDVEDVFGLQVYVVNRDPESLLAAAETEAGIDLERDGGYIGQVAEMSDGGGLVASPGISVAQAPPQGDLRFVNVIPRRAPTEPALLPADAMMTSTFGLFLVPALPGGEDPVVFQPFSATANYELVVTPLVPGMVAFGVHLRRP